MSQNLPKELTRLVDWAVSTLGQVILAELGTEKFNRIEKIRQHVKSRRGQTLSGLLKLKDEFSLLSQTERYEIAHAFALMLELINSCEAAYRTSRLRSEKGTARNSSLDKYGRVIHVLTAHPTESRSSDIIHYFRKIQALLIKHLEKSEIDDNKSLYFLLKLTWHIPMSKRRKPSVMDEAEYIYSIVLQDDIIDIYLRQRHKGQPFYIRTWVGGDKDGHPGVNEKTMLGSLQMSRNILLAWLEKTLRNFLNDLEPLCRAPGPNKKMLQELRQNAVELRYGLKDIKILKKADSNRVHNIKDTFGNLSKTYREIFSMETEDLHSIQILFKVFPALVVPLELREDSELVREALKAPDKKFAISRMLRCLVEICPDHDPRSYVRGLILSQTEDCDDMLAGVKLVKRILGANSLPVVPLFESANSLSAGVDIVNEFLSVQSRLKIVQKNWSGKFEVMLGYSDSAKESGSFPSRFLIQSAVKGLEKRILSFGLKPIFFHGSGGSIERGGGSVQEQTAWWPESALGTVKVTVQGEMIYRNYTAPEILERQLDRFASARGNTEKKISHVEQKRLDGDLKRLSDFIKQAYQTILHEPQFLDLIEKATPYSYLKDLKLGSRPAKRQGPVQLKGLRAIPWVLCWTQTRALFPVWWGVGSFWQSLSSLEKKRYRQIFRQSSVFSSYIKVLGFTLSKVDLEVFSFYLNSSSLSKDLVNSTLKRFRSELELSQKAVREITGQESLLWFRPWLETSIALRSPLIHPLNILQVLALQEHDVPLIRETVTGVASGMMTTG